MYTMVLMAALSGSGDVASFGKKSSGCSGCTGEVVTSCCGGEVASCHGSKHFGGKLFGGGGGLFSKHKSKSCDGGCHGSEPAPVCDTCAVPAPTCDTCSTPAPVEAPGCALPGAPVVVTPAPAAPAPMPIPEKKPEEPKKEAGK